MGKGSVWAAVLGPCLVVAGCKSPFSKEEGDEVLRRRVAGAVERELGDVADDDRLLETTQPESIVAQEPSLLDRADELQTIGPRVLRCARKSIDQPCNQDRNCEY